MSRNSVLATVLLAFFAVVGVQSFLGDTVFGQAFPDVYGQENRAEEFARKQRRGKSISERLATLEEQVFVTRSRIKKSGGGIGFPGVKEADAKKLASKQVRNKTDEQRLCTLEEQNFVTRARIEKSDGSIAFPGVDEKDAADLAEDQRQNKTFEERLEMLEVQMFVTRARMP